METKLENDMESEFIQERAHRDNPQYHVSRFLAYGVGTSD